MCDKEELTDYTFSVWWEKDSSTGIHYLCIDNKGLELVRDVEVFVDYTRDGDGVRVDTIGYSQPKDKPYHVRLFTSEEYEKCELSSADIFLKYNGKIFVHTVPAPKN